MKKLILPIAFALSIIGCKSSTDTASNEPVANQINVGSFKTEQPFKQFFRLVGVDGKPYTGKEIKPGPHIFFIEGIEEKNTASDQLSYSMHSVKVRLEDKQQYEIVAQRKEGVLNVWVINTADQQIASSLSSIPETELHTLPKTKKMEKILIKGNKWTRMDKIGVDRSAFCQSANAQNETFAGSITARKMPDRHYIPKC